MDTFYSLKYITRMYVLNYGLIQKPGINMYKLDASDTLWKRVQ